MISRSIVSQNTSGPAWIGHGPGRFACLFGLLLPILAAGCGGGQGEEDEGPLQLSERWDIDKGEPVFLMDEGETDLLRNHSNERKDDSGRLVAFDYDYSSKRTNERFHGKVYNIGRDAEGKVNFFDFTINGFTDFKRAGSQSTKTERKMVNLQGNWVCVSAVVDGKPIPEETVKALKLELTGEQYTTRNGDTVLFKGGYQLDPSRNPLEIDIIALEGAEKGQVALGIFRLDKDTLVKEGDRGFQLADRLNLCYAMPPAKERPKTFASSPGSGIQFSVWKRAQP
jgi:uncharacterized protein (TIGR03067 family)